MIRNLSRIGMTGMRFNPRIYQPLSRSLLKQPSFAFSNKKNNFDDLKRKLKDMYDKTDSSFKNTNLDQEKLNILFMLLAGFGIVLTYHYVDYIRNTAYYQKLSFMTYSVFKDMVDTHEIKEIVIMKVPSKKSNKNIIIVKTYNQGDYQLLVKDVEDFIKNLEHYQKHCKTNEKDFINVRLNLFELDKGIISKAILYPFMILLFFKVATNFKSFITGIGSINRSQSSNIKLQKINPDKIPVNFGSIAGLQNAKLEIKEFVDFLKNPQIFNKLGARMPKGALLTGPPGTGKTLLAKACAKEAGVSFYSVSGSEFVEKYVGVGSSNVRQLFKEARNNAPSVIFIDEIDAIGKKRGDKVNQNSEREHTLNQLLVEMDGFDTQTNVVVLAATNREDVLDPALKRPGRFDRILTLTLPDIGARKEIFDVYLKDLNLEDKSEEAVDRVAKRLSTLTPGFSGADIANLCNEAAIVAARLDHEFVTPDHFEEATERVLGGLRRKNLVNNKERQLVAVHESGHAVASWFLKGADPLLKVTIVARSKGALGFAQYLVDDSDHYTKSELIDKIIFILGGRIAEEIFFDRISTGANDDLQKAYGIAQAMVTSFGMTDISSYLNLSQDKNQGYIQAINNLKLISEKTHSSIDDQINAIIDSCSKRCKELLTEKKDEVKRLSEKLLEKESVDLKDLTEILGDKPYSTNNEFKAYLGEAV